MLRPSFSLLSFMGATTNLYILIVEFIIVMNIS